MRVGPEGYAIGVDMTAAMRERASAGAAACGMSNVQVRDGDATGLGVDSERVDVVTSNGVLNLVPDKHRAIAEIARILKPGGRVQIADIVIGEVLPDEALGHRLVDRLNAGALLKQSSSRLSVRRSGAAHYVAVHVSTAPPDAARRYGVVGVNFTAMRAQTAR
jgi:ubiquinone/menaquinone biosynthesis C-methylase UbiE